MIALLGIWGALIPFVGPYFDYSFGTNSTWQYTTNRLWLDIVPGAVALLAGVVMLTARTRGTAAFGAWLAILAGVWFVIGPAVSLTWAHTSWPIGAPLYGSTRQMLELVGYFYLLGGSIIALGAFVLGRVVPAREVAPARELAPAHQLAPARRRTAMERPAVERSPEAERPRAETGTDAAEEEPSTAPRTAPRQPARRRVHMPFSRSERTRY